MGVWWPSVSSCARILFREAGIAIPRIRDISREFGKFSESPGFFRESGKFFESPGSFPRVRVASARIRKTCQTNCARAWWARQLSGACHRYYRLRNRDRKPNFFLRALCVTGWVCSITYKYNQPFLYGAQTPQRLVKKRTWL